MHTCTDIEGIKTKGVETCGTSNVTLNEIRYTFAVLPFATYSTAGGQ